MEITTFGMYLFTRLDTLKSISIICSLLGVVFVIVFIFLLLVGFMADDKDATNSGKFLLKRKLLWVFAIISWVLFCLIPTQKEAAAIYLVPNIVNNEKVQQLPNNAVELLNKQLESWINDLDISDNKEDK